MHRFTHRRPHDSPPGQTDLFLRGLRWEDLVEVEGHGLALVGEVEDRVIVRVEADHVPGLGGDVLLVADRPHPAEHPDVAWGTGNTASVTRGIGRAAPQEVNMLVSSIATSHTGPVYCPSIGAWFYEHPYGTDSDILVVLFFSQWILIVRRFEL